MTKRIDYTRALDTWDDESWLMDWYAVDSYDPVTERIERVMVATEEDALHYMREYASQPAEVAFSRFYRCQVISEQSARRWFEHVRENPGEPYELMDESIESVSLNEAAAAMGVSRQRAHVLYREGRILGHKVRGKLRIDAASVQRFIENRADTGR